MIWLSFSLALADAGRSPGVVGDVRSLPYEAGSFDIAIDKGTMDAMMTGVKDVWVSPHLCIPFLRTATERTPSLAQPRILRRRLFQTAVPRSTKSLACSLQVEYLSICAFSEGFFRPLLRQREALNFFPPPPQEPLVNRILESSTSSGPGGMSRSWR